MEKSRVAESVQLLYFSFTKYDGPPERVRVPDPQAGRAHKRGPFCFLGISVPYALAMSEPSEEAGTPGNATSAEEENILPVRPVRVEIFVDASNFQPGVEESGITHPIGYGKLAANLCDASCGEILVGLHYVAGAFRYPRDNDPRMPPGEFAKRLGRYNSTNQLFARVAQEPGVTVWKERYVYRTPDAEDPREVVEKGADMRVGLLMYEGARDNRYDRAILIASDADFVPAVEMVKRLGKEVVWAYPPAYANFRALTQAGATPRELTAEFLETCRYTPAAPVGGLKGAARHV